MKVILMTLIFAMTLGHAKAEVSWNDFVVPEALRLKIDNLLEKECPIMMSQEVFEVIDVKTAEVSQLEAFFTVELKGRGYGSGDPDHHFIILINERKKGPETFRYNVKRFTVLAECH